MSAFWPARLFAGDGMSPRLAGSRVRSEFAADSPLEGAGLNPRSLSGTLPGPAHARLPNAARTLCLRAVAQELPLHRVHMGDICRDVVVTAAFAGD
jgi:hypothetical protein